MGMEDVEEGSSGELKEEQGNEQVKNLLDPLCDLACQPLAEEDRSCSNWMRDLGEEGLGELSLFQTLIPGSHDSATSEIRRGNDYASDGPKFLQTAGRFMRGGPLKRLVCRWAIAQERTVAQQLLDGIRYLDLRVVLVKPHTNAPTGDLFTCHAVLSDKLDDVLGAVGHFLTEHPREIVILDFNHFYGMNEASFDGLAQQLKDIFGDRLANKEVSIHNTIGHLWEMGISVFVFFDKEDVVRKYQFLRSQSQLKSAWMDAPDIHILKDRLDGHLNLRRECMAGNRSDKRDYNQILHVTQGIVTPDPRMIARSAFGSYSLLELGRQVSPLFLKWVREDWRHHHLNIIIIDHYHFTHFVPLLIQMNQERLRALGSSFSLSNQPNVQNDPFKEDISDGKFD